MYKFVAGNLSEGTRISNRTLTSMSMGTVQAWSGTPPVILDLALATSALETKNVLVL